MQFYGTKIFCNYYLIGTTSYSLPIVKNLLICNCRQRIDANSNGNINPTDKVTGTKFKHLEDAIKEQMKKIDDFSAQMKEMNEIIKEMQSSTKC